MLTASHGRSCSPGIRPIGCAKPLGHFLLRPHTTGGPFRTLQITDLEELEYRGRGIDVFWCWRGAPQEGQRRDRPLKVGLWSCGRLRSEQQAAVRIVNGGV